MRRSLFPFVPTAVLLSAVIFAFGCSGQATSQTQGGGRGGRGGEVVPVTVAPVVQKEMPIDIRVIGTAEAYSTVALRSQITGQLTSVTFKEGDDVRKDQVLFTLDRRPLDAALLQAQANLQRDIAQAANAQAQAARYQDLAERGIATKEQLETSRTGAAALNATVEADRAAVENAKIQLQYATIAAPIAGRTGALMVNEGNLVRANDTTPLVVINQITPIYVSFAIPESRLAEFKRYMAQGMLRVEATPPADTGPTSKGRITFVDNSVDQTTGTIRIKGAFGNEDRRLWPGQFVNVVVTLTTDRSAIVVPTVAVQASQQGSFVFVVKSDSTVDLRQVQVARTQGSETVISTGLKPGETVVTDGHLRLVPGSRISVKPGDSSESSRVAS
jgi:multidrug efflux system membrane fusion protein